MRTPLPPFPGSPAEAARVRTLLYGPGVVSLWMVTFHEVAWSEDLQTPQADLTYTEYRIDRHSVTKEVYEWAQAWLADPGLLPLDKR